MSGTMIGTCNKKVYFTDISVCAGLIDWKLSHILNRSLYKVKGNIKLYVLNTRFSPSLVLLFKFLIRLGIKQLCTTTVLIKPSSIIIKTKFTQKLHMHIIAIK